nr:immunoglobulin light chain junction region [Macaca mulatta]
DYYCSSYAGSGSYIF